MTVGQIFLQSAIKRLNYYKALGNNTFNQLAEDDFHVQLNVESNSLCILIQHMAGNMLSRWTNFLISDGEKDWRKRDAEFEEQHLTKQQLIDLWETGWACCLNALQALNEEDLIKTIHIRHEACPVIDAINRQLAHYPYHVGQIIYLAKIIKNKDWQQLSIAKGHSEEFNRQLHTKA